MKRPCPLRAAWLAAAFIAGTAARAAPTVATNVAAASGIRLRLDKPHALYTGRERITVRLEFDTHATHRNGLVLIAEDAWGAQRLQRAWTDTSAVIRLPKADRHYLKLRLVSTDQPTVTLDWCALAVIAPIAATDARFGFNTQPDLAPLVRQLGGRWVRTHLPWEQGRPDQPQGTNGTERAIAAIHAAGCEVFGISSYSLPWASVTAPDDRRSMRGFFSVPRPEPWDAYVQHVARQVRGRVPIFEVWNEPNFDHFWASVPNTPEQCLDDYAALLRRTHAIMKREAPELRVTTGSIVSLKSRNHHPYFRGLLARGCGEAFDVLNVHYYRGGTSPEDTARGAEGRLETFLDGFTQALRDARLERPVWMTEIGWSSTDPGWGFVSEYEQMCYLVRSHVLCFANQVEAVLWFKLEDEPFGLLSLERGPKPAAAAYAQMVRALGGKAFRTALASDNCRAYLFGDGSDQVVVAWALSPESWHLPEGSRITRMENALGETMPRPRRDAMLALTGAPIYLHGRFGPR